MLELEEKVKVAQDLQKPGISKYFNLKNLCMTGAAVVAVSLIPDNAYAGSGLFDAPYGYFAGFRDGFLLLTNMLMNVLDNGRTWAADGTGLISEPNNGFPYYVGFFTSVSSFYGSGISVTAKKSKSKK